MRDLEFRICGDYSGAWEPTRGRVKSRLARGEHFFLARWKSGDAELGFFGIYHPALGGLKKKLPAIIDDITSTVSVGPNWDELKYLSRQTPGWGLYYSCADYLRLWRDPFGTLPIVLSFRNQGIHWATRPAYLPVPPTKVRQSRVFTFLSDQNDWARDDFWQGVFRLRAGETIHFRRGNDHDFQTWWPGPITDLEEPVELAECTRRLLQESQKRAIAHGARAVSLSGGVDSTLIAALMVESGLKPKAFSMIDPRSPLFDEEKVIEITAEHLNIDVSFFDVGKKLKWAHPEIHHPIPDFGPATMSEAAYMLPFLRHIKDNGHGVYCSGQGADHLFSCRPDEYLRHRVFEEGHWREIAKYSRRKTALRHGLHRFGIPTLAREAHAGPMPSWLTTSSGAVPLRLVEPFRAEDWKIRKMSQFQSWFWEEVCRLEERFRRVTGVLHLSPFLDPEVAEFAFSLPPSYLRTYRMDKKILRELLSARVPESVATRPKRGLFSEIVARGLLVYLEPPLEKWLDREILSTVLVEEPHQVYEKISRARHDVTQAGGFYGHPFWRLLAVALWQNEVLV